MQVLTLKDAGPVETLRVEIGKKSYDIPLAGSMTRAQLKKYDLNTADGTAAFLESYIPADVLDELTMNEYNSIVRTWVDASQEAAGTTPGE